MSLNPITSGLSGNAWAEVKSDIFIVISVPGSRMCFEPTFLSYHLAIIPVFGLLLVSSGRPEMFRHVIYKHRSIPALVDRKSSTFITRGVYKVTIVDIAS